MSHCTGHGIGTGLESKGMNEKGIGLKLSGVQGVMG